MNKKHIKMEKKREYPDISQQNKEKRHKVNKQKEKKKEKHC